MKKITKILLIICASLMLVLGGTVLFTNIHIVNYGSDRILDKEAIDIDCIIILGAGVRKDGTPSPMLRDRLDAGIELYKRGVAPKIIMTGDHGQNRYDEVTAMKQYAINKGVPSEDIFMDHAGFSTYDSMFREKEVFEVKKAVIVTQKYHMYRALYIANKLGIEARGVPAEDIKYSGQLGRDIREVLARTKDYFKVIIKPNPKYLGETIDITGNGDVTND
ncbi:MAG: YdcF family protein [Bacilli bacterium]|nr:YdcF family protein [Bacilli bacterium]